MVAVYSSLHSRILLVVNRDFDETQFQVVNTLAMTMFGNKKLYQSIHTSEAHGAQSLRLRLLIPRRGVLWHYFPRDPNYEPQNKDASKFCSLRWCYFEFGGRISHQGSQFSLRQMVCGDVTLIDCSKQQKNNRDFLKKDLHRAPCEHLERKHPNVKTVDIQTMKAN